MAIPLLEMNVKPSELRTMLNASDVPQVTQHETCREGQVRLLDCMRCCGPEPPKCIIRMIALPFAACVVARHDEMNGETKVKDDKTPAMTEGRMTTPGRPCILGQGSG